MEEFTPNIKLLKQFDLYADLNEGTIEYQLRDFPKEKFLEKLIVDKGHIDLRNYTDTIMFAMYHFHTAYNQAEHSDSLLPYVKDLRPEY